MSTTRANGERRRLPLTRIALGLAVGGPALMLGGVPPWAVTLSLGLAMLAGWQLTRRHHDRLPIPGLAVGLAVAAGWTALQWLPLPGIRAWVAPSLHELVDQAVRGTGISCPGLTVSRGDTAIEVGRLVALAIIATVAHQLSWRFTASVVTVTSALVVGIGLIHETMGNTAIYGLYTPRFGDRSTVAALMGSFVNPNHQSSLLLLGLFAAIALAIDQAQRALETHDPSRIGPYRDRMWAAWVAAFASATGLLLSLSRAAIVLGLVLLPIALWMIPRRTGPSLSRPHRRSPLAYVYAGAMLIVLALVASHGASREIETLWSTKEGLQKLVMLRSAVPCLWISPLVGTGRGTLIDLLPLHDPAPTHVVATHLESVPLTMLIEWGWIVGGLLLIATAWGLISLFTPSHSTPQRVAALGVVAVVLHNTVDFSLEFLGVAAPTVALASALAPPTSTPNMMANPIRRLVAITGALALMLVLGHRHRSWITRTDHNTLHDLATRPLDGALHLALGRDAAQAERWPQALHHAEVATRHRPGAIDAWLLLATVAQQQGQPEQQQQAWQRALALLHEPMTPTLATHLLQAFPHPTAIADIAPPSSRPWQWMLAGIEAADPITADAVAAARLRQVPNDTFAWLARARIATQRGWSGPALYHAQMARASAPTLAATHLAVVAALVSFEPPRLRDSIDTLEAALLHPALNDATQRAAIEERLVRLHLIAKTPDDLRRGLEIGQQLLHRPASLETRRARAQLIEQLRHALSP